MPNPLYRWLTPLVALALAQCMSNGPAAPTGRLAIDVAPLNLAGITDADYTLTVTNGPDGTGDVVWTRAVTSQAYGDGAGSLAYVGTCDAGTGVNTVSLTLTALHDAGGLVAPGTYMNPTDPTPIARQVTCVDNADVAVQFDITLARRADQGFFDVAVQFEDIFCSAKLDCQDAAGDDLELLHDATGARDMTVVLGFACTGSLSGTTYLYLDDPVIECTGLAQDVRVDPTGLGNVDLAAAPSANASSYLFASSVYRGVEGFAGKAYWNVSFGLDATTFAAAGTCVLTTRGTASDIAFPQEPDGFPLPEGSVYPVIDWQVTLSDATHRVCTRHQVNQLDSGVATHYLGYLPLFNGFTWSPDPIYLKHRFEPSSGVVLSAGAPICNPGCAHGACIATNVCDCSGTGYDGETCAAPVCTAPCVNGGVCSAPDTCDCAGTGYAGATCAADVDECATDNGGCDPNATCTNTAGGRTCACDAGYTGDGTVCGDSDGCALTPCATGVTCTDVAAPDTGRTCGACPSGSWGDGATCTPCAAVTGCAGALTCSSASDSLCATCAAGTAQGAAGAPCLEIDGCAGAPCGAVTCFDVPAPGTGYSCAVPDATSLLACSPTTLAVGEQATCTITPRQGGATITALASSFTPSASSGSVSAVTPASGTALTFTFTAAYAGTVTLGSGLGTTTVSVHHLTDAGTTSALAGFDCQDLLTQGVITSGTYWIDPSGAAPFEVYCEQQRHGGGWTVLYNSVGDPAGQTRAFWDIAYADRFAHKGAADIDANLYEPQLYRYVSDYLDVAEDLSGGVAELFRATAQGIDDATMAMVNPVYVSGDVAVYDRQFAAGWSSSDSDHDPYADNCAVYYGGTQHYASCWRYALAADADPAVDPTFADGGWGPHVWGTLLTSLGLALEVDGGDYSRVQRITRLVKLCTTGGCTAQTAAFDCEELLAAGVTTSGTYWIDPTRVGAEQAYCEMEKYGGGWTLLFNSVGQVDGPTRAFWTILYADRLAGKGTPSLAANYYDPALYFGGGTFIDVVEDVAGSDAELFRATALGINGTTMALRGPSLVSGNADLYGSQFAGGWASPDADYDTYGSNCAVSYGTTQHYTNCWGYNLGSDADAPYADANWGPHVYYSYLPPVGLTYGADGSYVRVNRITRFVKPAHGLPSCLAWRALGYTTSDSYLIDPESGGAPFAAYCDMTTDGGGWTLLAVGGAPCPTASIHQVSATGAREACSYLREPSVRAVAEASSTVRLTAGSAFGSWSADVRSTNGYAIAALQTGGDWHRGDYTLDRSTDWTGSWLWAPREPACAPAVLGGWPQMYHSCSSGAGVHWLMAGGYLEGFFQEPVWNHPAEGWIPVTATWVR